ncbi:MAG: putative magnesium or manganese-dependent protein phosphatase, partial [Acidimicrobiales bacterium]|nr:putative magnesium or manganese-dependent protein phosphatase [Acidimicrobiales bacterium]
MADRGARRLDLRTLLSAVEERPPIDAVDALAAQLATLVDATHVSLLIANFSGTAVVRLSHVTDEGELRNGHNERTEALPLDGSVYERVLFTQELEVLEDAGTHLVLVPITERGDAIGILELSVPRRPDAGTVDDLVAAAHALSYVLIASRRHTDLFEWAQRDTPFSLAAEIQRRLLPSAYTAECGAFTIAGWLEPAHDAGGDTFDYSIDREHLYVSITDPVGHSTQAALLATITVGSLRNSRRALASPAEQAGEV